eukprot:TRINITY_DN6193_c2_g1_i1.p1 TRINITY_DN6193_c2_g1~~TRINITY_DN6193_c2_g1_i1.p1  ORF type:complete len:506 (+),score=83.04 TRINITY_DN6193_c2_g1_i1:81-1520(+)
MIIPILVILSFGVAMLLALTLWLVKMVKGELIPKVSKDIESSSSTEGSSSAMLVQKKPDIGNVPKHMWEGKLKKILGEHKLWSVTEVLWYYPDVKEGFECPNSLSQNVGNIKKLLTTDANETRASIRSTSIPGEDWEKTHLLGSGSFGEVWKTHTPRNKTPIAVKVIHVPRDASDTSIDSLMKEIYTMAGLNCPEIVRYHGSAFKKPTRELHLFMEYMGGGTLSDFLKQPSEPFPAEQKSFCKQILKGMACLHDNKIAHRDIKAENILMTNDFTIVKISDFGTAKRLKSSCGVTHARTAIGTPLWMAPEVIRGCGDQGYGVAADVWSFGCLMVEIFNKGSPPWTKEMKGNCWMAMNIIGSWDKDFPLGIPDNLPVMCLEMMKECFRIDPGKRWTAAQLRKHPYLTNPDSYYLTEEKVRDIGELRHLIQREVRSPTPPPPPIEMYSVEHGGAPQQLPQSTLPGFTAAVSIEGSPEPFPQL